MVKKISIVFMILLLGVTELYSDCSLHVSSSNLQGVTVYIDGISKKVMNKGFTSIAVDCGKHTIKLSKYAYASKVQDIVLIEGKVLKLIFKLKKQMTVKEDISKLARWQRDAEIVKDAKSGLMWQDNAEAKKTAKPWVDAKKYCQNLSLGGYDDWRLPNYDALLTIVDYDRHDPAIIPSFKNVYTMGYYWTSSQYVKSPVNKFAPRENNLAWRVSFNDGTTDHQVHINNHGYVRCVRGVYGE